MLNKGKALANLQKFSGVSGTLRFEEAGEWAAFGQQEE